MGQKPDASPEILKRGRWSASGGTVTLVWGSGGRSVHDYEILSVYVDRDTLLWTTPERVRWRRAK